MTFLIGSTLQVLVSVIILLPAFSLPSRQLVVILLDGMRWDYLDLLTPDALGGFIHFMKTGVRAEYLETVFPSISYPAYTTIQTGLFPESHNVLGNYMYDRTMNLEFNSSTLRLPVWWQDAEPIWVTVTKQGLRAATILWNNADVPYHGILPEVAEGYKYSERSLTDKINEVILRLKAGFDLVMMFHEDLDIMTHSYGPASTPVKEEMRKVARGLQQLFSHIKDEGHERRVHVIVMSDHGSTPSCTLPYADLRQVIDVKRTTEKVLNYPGVVAIYSKLGHIRELHSKLQTVPGYITRLRKDIPEEFHYKRSQRAPDLLMYNTPLNGSTRSSLSCNRGTHGGDPREPSMRGFFAAWGDAFAGGGLVHPPLRLVDVYQLYAHVLKVQPRPHNGSWLKVRRLLRDGSVASGQDGQLHLSAHGMVVWICCIVLLTLNLLHKLPSLFPTWRRVVTHHGPMSSTKLLSRAPHDMMS